MGRMIDDEETLKDNGLIEIDGVNVAECWHFNSEWNNCNICKDLIKTKKTNMENQENIVLIQKI